MPLMGLPLMSGMGHEVPVFFSCAAASATDHSALKTGNIIFFPEGTVQLRLSIFPSVDPARNHICPEGSAGQLSNVVTENAYCHHFALHWPYVSPPTWPFIARTPGFIPSAKAVRGSIVKGSDIARSNAHDRAMTRRRRNLNRV